MTESSSTTEMAGFLTRAFDFPVRIDPKTPRTVDLAYTNGLLSNVTGYGTLSYHPNLLIHQVTHGNGVVETWSNDPNSMRRPRSITPKSVPPDSSAER